MYYLSFITALIIAQTKLKIKQLTVAMYQITRHKDVVNKQLNYVILWNKLLSLEQSCTTIESEKALQINYTYDDIRKWLDHFRALDYSKTKNRKALIDTFIYRVVLYDDKMKVLFNLKSGQKNELLLNLIFPDYPDGNGGEDGSESENSAKEKETENSVSFSRCSYTPVMVPVIGVEPIRYHYHGILSPARLPIPPHRRTIKLYIIAVKKSSDLKVDKN